MDLKRFVADLHIHTCLSQCAELDMTPKRIIDNAIKKGLDIIAITDHNSAENAKIAIEIGCEKGILVLPAMEVTSQEEVHVLAMFDSIDKALNMQELVYNKLPSGTYLGRFHGYQLIVNERDEIIRFDNRPLFSATSLSIKEVVDNIHSLGGIAIASHIDREVFSIISHLGFIPYDLDFDALEISYNKKRHEAESLFNEYIGIPWITSSDAHHLKDVGRRTVSFFLKEPSFEEVLSALRGERRIDWND